MTFAIPAADQFAALLGPGRGVAAYQRERGKSHIITCSCADGWALADSLDARETEHPLRRHEYLLNTVRQALHARSGFSTETFSLSVLDSEIEQMVLALTWVAAHRKAVGSSGQERALHPAERAIKVRLAGELAVQLAAQKAGS